MKLNRIAAAGLAALALVLALNVRADFSSKDWQYYLMTSLPPAGPDGFVGLEVTETVYNHAAPGLLDLRVLGPAGEEVPYILAVQRGALEETTYTPQIINAVVIPDQRQEFVLDLGQRGQKNNQIQLLTSSTNFKRPVKLYGADDASDWKLIREGFFIFDFSGDVHAADLTLRYSENIFRYLKVELGLDGGAPLDITGVIMRQSEIKNQGATEFKQLSFVVTENDKLKATDVAVAFAHANLPVNSFVFTVDAPEFYRTVQLFRDKEFKRQIGEGVIYRYTIGNFSSEELSLRFNEALFGAAYLRIQNHDNQPLKIKDVAARGDRRVVIFRPPAAEGVKLYYGAPKAQRPVYDLAQLYPKVAEQTPELGAFLPGEKTNPDFIAPVVPPPPAPPRNYTLLLWIILVPVAGFLAYLVFRSLREIETKDGDQGGDKK